MTNDDKDLNKKKIEPCPIANIVNSVIFNDDDGLDKRLELIRQLRELWNTRSTPQHPSEPLKELDEVRAKLKEFYTDYESCVTPEERRGCLDHWESEFGQPSEKKALSVKDIESIIETTAFNQGESFIDKKPYAQAIHSALPAQREVRYPEKLDHDHSCEFDCKGCISNGWNQAINKMRKLNGDKT